MFLSHTSPKALLEKKLKTLTASRLLLSCSILRSSARLAAPRSTEVGVPGEALPCGEAFISSTLGGGIGSTTGFL